MLYVPAPPPTPLLSCPRLTVYAFLSVTDNKAMMNRVYDNLASGGWAEFHELAGECVGEDAEAEELYQRSAFRQWHRYLMDGGLAIGRDFRAPHKYKQW